MDERFSEPRIHAILADAAQSVNNKLYIVGGGWSQIMAHVPTNMSIAFQLVVPWSRTNEDFRVKAYLTSQDSDDVLNIGQGPIQMEMGTEVGRPPGIDKGTSLTSHFVFDFPQIAVPPGGYVWHIHLNDDEKQSLPFVAIYVGLPAPSQSEE